MPEEGSLETSFLSMDATSVRCSAMFPICQRCCESKQWQLCFVCFFKLKDVVVFVKENITPCVFVCADSVQVEHYTNKCVVLLGLRLTEEHCCFTSDCHERFSNT